MFSYLLLGAGYGFAAAAQPGAFQSYLISQTLSRGWRRALPVIFAPLLSDTPIIAFVLLVLSQIPPWWLRFLRLAGGAFVVYLAWSALQAWREGGGSAQPSSLQSGGLFQAVLVNFLNPGPYLFWSLVSGPLLIAGWREAPLYGVSLLTGFYTAMTCTLAAILLVSAGAGKLGAGVNRALVGLSALVLFGFGLYQIWQGIYLG